VSDPKDKSHVKIGSWRLAWPALVALAVALLGTSSVFAEDATGIECTIRFQLQGNWTIYERADGTGMVSCADGTAIPVVVEARGLGLSIAKSKIGTGTGNFGHVHRISDVIGSYAQTGVDAAAMKSGPAQLLTKGGVSLALAGKGNGLDLGIGVERFTISRAN
jgi:hypothetical protein